MKSYSIFNRIAKLMAIIAIMALGFLGFKGLAVQSMALEQEVRCGIEAHIHNADCYQDNRLICSAAEHVHNKNCYLVLLEDNDINEILAQMDQNRDNSLEGLIGQTVDNALVYNTNLTSPLAEGTTLADVAALNQTIEENDVQPAMVFNENIQVAAASGDTLGAVLPVAEGPSTFALGDTESKDSSMANYYVYLDGEWTFVGSMGFELSTSNNNRYSPYESVGNIVNLYNDALDTSITTNEAYFDYATSETSRTWNDATKSNGTVSFGQNYRDRTEATHTKYVRLVNRNGNAISFYTVTLNNYPGTGDTTYYYVRSGQNFTLPSGYNWTENNTSHSGGSTILNIRSARTFNAGYTVSLTYPDGTTTSTAVSPGGTFTLPEGIVWKENNNYINGGTILSVSSSRSFTGYYQVTLNYQNGDVTKHYLSSGASFTLPQGITWWEGENEFEGGSRITVTSAREFTEGAPDPRIKISYDVNFPTISGVTVSTKPVLLNTSVSTIVDRVEEESGTRVRSVSNPLVTGSVNNTNNGLSRAVHFVGWKLNNTDTIIEAAANLGWSELVAYANGGKSITLTGVWEYDPLQTASFFIRYDSVAADTSGNTGGQDVTSYTDEIFATFVGGVDTNLGSNTLQSRYGIADTSADNSYTADQSIRGLLGQKAEGVWLYSFPDDAYVFEQLKKDTTGKLRVDGKAVDVEDLNSNVYTIRWYVFKSQSDAWHIDGRLVKKEGLLDISKTFAGNKAAVAAAKEGFYIVAQNDVNTNEKYYLYLETPTPKPTDGTVLLPKTSSGDYYLWTISGTTYGEGWTITEHPVELADAVVHGSYRVVDIYGDQSKAGTGFEVSLTATTVATDMDEWQALTLNFTNIYHNTNSIIIKKEDKLTGAPLAGATFQLLQNDVVMRFEYDSANKIYKYNQESGDITELTSSESGYYELNVQGFQYSKGNIVVKELHPPTGYTPIENIIIGYPAAQSAVMRMAKPQTEEEVEPTTLPEDDLDELQQEEPIPLPVIPEGEKEPPAAVEGEQANTPEVVEEPATGPPGDGVMAAAEEPVETQEETEQPTEPQTQPEEEVIPENTPPGEEPPADGNGEDPVELTPEVTDPEAVPPGTTEPEETVPDRGPIMFAPAPKTESEPEPVAEDEGEDLDNAAVEILNPSNMASYNNGLLIVRNGTESTSVTVDKRWNCDDADRRDVTVQLMANGAPVTALISGVDLIKELTEENGYTATWTGLPLYANGQKITWSVKEIKIGSESCLPDYSFINWLVDYSPASYTYDDEGRLVNTSFTITNDTYRTLLRLVKTNIGGGIRLQGAKFLLEHLVDGEVDADFVQKVGVTDADGVIVFDNLKYGDYRLTEVEAPSGYEKLEKPIYLTIQANGTVTVQDNSHAIAGSTAYSIQVLNDMQRPLPETGGPGVAGHLLSGLLLMAASAGTGFFYKRKKGGKTPT